MHHRRLPRRRLRRDRARARARVALARPRQPRLARIPGAQEPHLPGPREASRHVHRARAAAAGRSQRRRRARRHQGRRRQRRRREHAVHLGHDRIPQRRHAHPPQHLEQRLLHRRPPEPGPGRPRLPARAALSLLRLRARRAGHPHARRHAGHDRGLRPAARAGRRAEGAGHRALRRAHHVHRRAGAPHVLDVRPHQPAHRHHGRQPVPHRDHAPGDATRCTPPSCTICLRPHRDVAGVHADVGRRHARAQVRDRRHRQPRGRGAGRRPAHRRDCAPDDARRVLLPRLQRDEGLLQHARGDGRGDRRRRLAALRRHRHDRRPTATTASPAASRT